MTPDEQLERLDAELDRLNSEHPNVHGILRLSEHLLTLMLQMEVGAARLDHH